MKSILIISLLLLSCGAKEIDKTHVFYLHGRIIEEQGRRPAHPEFGVYEYDEILRQLGGEGRVVVSEARPKGTDPVAYAAKVGRLLGEFLTTSSYAFYVQQLQEEGIATHPYALAGGGEAAATAEIENCARPRGAANAG